MKKTFSIILAGTLYITALSARTEEINISSTSMHTMAIDSSDNLWILIPVLPSDSATGKLPTLSLDMAHKTFKGFTGCNDISGGFFIAENAIKFSTDITMTKMLCEGYNEKVFIENLLRVNSFRIEDGILVLMDGQTPLSKWKSKKAGNTI